MLARIIILASVVFVTACASDPPRRRSEQSCYSNSKTVVSKKNGKVLDEVTREEMDCSDDPIAHLPTTRLGMADNCYHMKKFIPRNGQYGQYVETTFIACQDPFTGNWKPVSQ